ncbi:MAG: hypothetical protein M1817_001052 [Caeruleum heppii]|nr:MAG: hypothetical protein M1817_001052 [Caeruleum heppii]
MSNKELPKLIIDEKDYGGLQRDNRYDSPYDRSIYKPPLASSDTDDTYKTVWLAPQKEARRYSELDATNELQDTGYSRVRAPIRTSSHHSAGVHSPDMTTLGSMTPVDQVKPEDEQRGGRKGRTICGLRPWLFFLIIITVLLLIIGGIVGGVLAVTVFKNRTSQRPSAQTVPSNTTADTIAPAVPSVNPALSASSSDAQIGTSLTAFSFNADPNVQTDNIRLFYQQNDGKSQLISYGDESTGWSPSRPIFTDAKNFSGHASFTRLDGDARFGHIFYTNDDDIIMEKRSSPSNPVWDLGENPINQLNFRTNGSLASPQDNGGTKLAVVYSSEFPTGPGARLFYHAIGDGTTGFVQELIWDEASDEWSVGQRIREAVPNSQLAATIDGAQLRLFYSAGQGTVQESFLKLDDENARYTVGMRQRGVMGRDDGPITAVAAANSTMVYFTDAQARIREIIVTNTTTQASVSLNSNAVGTLRSQNVRSLGSVCARANSDGKPQIHVFYADAVGSNPGALVVTRRPLDNPNWPSDPSGQTSNLLPLTQSS